MGETATHPEPEGLMSAIPDPEPEGLGCEPISIKCTAILDTQIKTKSYLKWWKYKDFQYCSENFKPDQFQTYTTDIQMK